MRELERVFAVTAREDLPIEELRREVRAAVYYALYDLTGLVAGVAGVRPSASDRERIANEGRAGVEAVIDRYLSGLVENRRVRGPVTAPASPQGPTLDASGGPSASVAPQA